MAPRNLDRFYPGKLIVQGVKIQLDVDRSHAKMKSDGFINDRFDMDLYGTGKVQNSTGTISIEVLVRCENIPVNKWKSNPEILLKQGQEPGRILLRINEENAPRTDNQLKLEFDHRAKNVNCKGKIQILDEWSELEFSSVWEG